MKLSIVSPWSGSTAHLWADFAAVAYGDAELIVVDDASDETTAKLLRESAPNVYRNDVAVGFAAACNQGYEYSTGDAICFLNSDVLLNETGVPLYIPLKDIDAHLNDRIVGASIVEQHVYAARIPYVEGWCICSTRSTWEKLITPGNKGPWDAVAYPTPYWEDVDLSFRANQLDIKISFLPFWTEHIYHKGGQTMGPSIKWAESYEKNRATLAARVRAELVEQGLL